MLMLLALAAAGPAQAPELCSDRPGLTTGTCTVEPGTFQVETSLVEWSRSRGQGAAEDDVAVVASRFRLGLGSRTDLHVVVRPYERSRVRDDGATSTAKGFGDVSLAVKHRLTAVDAPVGVAVLPFVKLPTASKEIGNGRVEGGVLLPIDIALSPSLGLTLTPEADWSLDGDGSGYHMRHAVAASVGFGLGGAWSGGLEALIGRERDGGQTTREGQVGGTVSMLAGPGLQLDVQLDAGVARGSPDLALSTGFTKRF